MGGFGSGRKGSYYAKTPVEDCLTISISALGRIHGNSAGRLSWYVVDREVASAGYVVVGESVRLVYNTDGLEVRLPIGLSTSGQYFGGVRFWMLCPIVKDGKGCGNRVGKLHLPPGETEFGCRDCYDLTYQSSQDAHKFDLTKSVANLMGLPAPDWA